MNIIDCAIIIILVLGAVVGFKEGIIKKAISTFGMIACILLAYLLKEPVGELLYNVFPNIGIGRSLNGLSSLNIMLYEAVAFVLIYAVLMIVYKILVKLAGVTEKVLKATVILSIPSKILGAIFGFIESYLFIYIVLFVLTLPLMKIDVVRESKVSNFMIKNTPIVSKVTDNAVKSINEIEDIINDKDNTDEINDRIIDVLKENKVITEDTAKNIIKNIKKEKK